MTSPQPSTPGTWIRHAARARIRGFTLVEMVMTIAVLAVLITLAAPAFRELMASQRVQTAAADLTTSLARARSEAIKQNTDVTITPTAGWAGGWTVASAAGDAEIHAATPGVTITSGAASVTYRSNGRLAPGEAPTFSFSSGDTSTARCVRVGLSGQAVVTKAACA